MGPVSNAKSFSPFETLLMISNKALKLSFAQSGKEFLTLAFIDLLINSGVSLEGWWILENNM